MGEGKKFTEADALNVRALDESRTRLRRSIEVGGEQVMAHALSELMDVAEQSAGGKFNVDMARRIMYADAAIVGIITVLDEMEGEDS